MTNDSSEKHKGHHFANQTILLLQYQGAGWLVFSKKTVQSLILTFLQAAPSFLPHSSLIRLCVCTLYGCVKLLKLMFITNTSNINLKTSPQKNYIPLQFRINVVVQCLIFIIIY